MHAIVETVERVRATSDSFGFVGANGGSMSKYSVGVYSTRPRTWTEWDDAENQQELDAVPTMRVEEHPSGVGTIETYTVRWGRDGSRVGIIIGRLVDETRFIATTASGDDETVDLLLGENPFGAVVHVATTGSHNFAAVERSVAEAAASS